MNHALVLNEDVLVSLLASVIRSSADNPERSKLRARLFAEEITARLLAQQDRSLRESATLTASRLAAQPKNALLVLDSTEMRERGATFGAQYASTLVMPIILSYQHQFLGMIAFMREQGLVGASIQDEAETNISSTTDSDTTRAADNG